MGLCRMIPKHRQVSQTAIRAASFIALILLTPACTQQAWNNPYPREQEGQNIFYSAFSERPKHLDPVQSYSSNEYAFIGQIYEPPFQYHYLRRPYELVPLTARKVARPVFLDREGRRLPEGADPGKIAFSVYEIRIRPGIRFQPHPAFARNDDGDLIYHSLRTADLKGVYTISDFPETGTRELVAADYVYEIKRLAHPKVHSPILGLMSEYIVGLREYARGLREAYERLPKDRTDTPYLDLRAFPLEGVEVVDRYTYRVKIHGKYPQFPYWLAMPFFAPIPHEADQFYSQPGMAERNLSLDWYPVGTGPFMLTVNNPNRQMVMERNPNFRGEPYPLEGDPGDREAGLLADAGRPMPFIEKAVYSLEKEDIPYWNKFLQGYYDSSGITSDSFDQAILLTGQGEISLTEPMREKGIDLITAVRATTIYMGFNMLDPVVGGYDERARKLRRAISIAFDFEEYISIFTNGRGIAAQGPLPPGLFGHLEGREGINPYVYDWVDGQAVRKSVQEARRLLAEAGYPSGRDARTGKPLLIHLDITATGPDDKARLDWMRKQLKKLDIQFVVRNTDYNRFQEKILTGSAQLFIWGWNADYPDPENFLFLLHGPNGKVKHQGENAANYDSPEFNRLFDQMKNMDNGPRRLQIIREMVDIARRDAPWIWGFHPKDFVLHHAWVRNAKPNLMANNTLKYRRIDPALRADNRLAWNRPVLWPVLVAAAALTLSLVPAVITYRRREHRLQR